MFAMRRRAISTEGMNWKGGDELLCVVFAKDTSQAGRA
jgi:hypothetical protein